MRLLILFLAFTTSLGLRSQNASDTLVNEGESQMYFVEGDTTTTDAISLDEVFVFNRLRFNDSKERRRYLILRRKTRKVYPFAKLAADRFTTLRERLAGMESNSQRKKYMRIIQRYVKDEFGERLKKLSRTEGQILVKLMHRQTGITTFDLVKEYRSGWKAFWLNTTASLFDIDLKEPFDPVNVEEDYLIEDILQRSFRADLLERQVPAGQYNFLELMNKWGAQDSTARVEE